MSSAPQSRPWDVHRLPSAEGRNFLVTGGNAGIGYFTAEQLAATGALVVIGSRNPAKADAALASIRSRVPGARVRHLHLDLADLSTPPVGTPTPGERLRGLPAALMVQGKDAGAWPVVRAVLDSDVQGGQLWGPRAFGLRGQPRREPVPAHMADPAVAAHLWAASAEPTGTTDPHLGFR
ncbi:SDR family NAD(P)-dependent oxidoreductase [Streptomyces sp. E5N91]|uniref:SDR family NAD(P)-dependent oxidoreductase n=1 Tax=Streptomyces sp. E5N91 TaxID=1851996 RepID=UPI00187D0F17|nr:SDR family NAD(P)-dependent oxidoreductase [Streptomyces sp. E5N91]